MEISNHKGNIKHFLHGDQNEESGGESNDDLDAAWADDHISGLDVNHPGDQLCQDPDISNPVTSAAEAESPSRESRPSPLDCKIMRAL